MWASAPTRISICRGGALSPPAVTGRETCRRAGGDAGPYAHFHL